MENNKFESEKCPEHDIVVKFIPPHSFDKRRKKLIVTFQCPKGHTYTKEFDLK